MIEMLFDAENVAIVVYRNTRIKIFFNCGAGRHTTQSNLSRQLNALEEELGKKLFERGTRKIVLTEEGMFLRKRTKEITELAERTETDIIDFDKFASGTVHIGAAETFAMRRLAEIMLGLREDYPNKSYDIFSGSTVEVCEQLNKGLLDFGVLVAPVDLTNYDYVKFPQNDVFGVIMKKNDLLAKLPYVCPDDLRDKPLLVARQQLDGNVLSGWFGQDVESLNIVSTFNLITTSAMMVAAGLGYAFTFANLVSTDKDGELTFRPLKPKLDTSLYLVWQKYRIFTKAAKAFLERVQKEL